MERGVGVAGIDMGLLNGQTAKRDSMGPAEGGGWLLTVNTAGVKGRGPRRQVDLGHISKILISGELRSENTTHTL
jgi:hypothetical protein